MSVSESGDALSDVAVLRSLGLRAAPIAAVLSLVLIRGASLNSAGVLYTAASGALTSGIGYAVWYSALRGLKAAQAATVQLSVPLLAALAGVVFLGESISLRLEKARELLSQYKFGKAAAELASVLAELKRASGETASLALAHELAGESAQRMGAFPQAQEHLQQAAVLLDELGEELAALRVDHGLLVLGGGPLGVSGHGCAFRVTGADARREDDRR